MPELTDNIQRAGQRAQQETFAPTRGAASTGWAIVGYLLLLVLVYWVVQKRVAGGIGRLWSSLGAAAQNWMSPTGDPLRGLANALGHKSGSQPATSSAQLKPGEHKPTSLPPSPSTIAHSTPSTEATELTVLRDRLAKQLGVSPRGQTERTLRRRAEQLGLIPQAPAHA